MGPWFRSNYPGLGSKKRSFLSKFFLAQQSNRGSSKRNLPKEKRGIKGNYYYYFLPT
jgi:hypothetical protein